MAARRTDVASRAIAAPPERLYRAFVDPTALAAWLPPAGMRGRIERFDPRPGGGYRMTLTYVDPEHSTAGKTAEHEDVVEARFAELVPDERIVQLVEFESDDPAFAGVMRMTWSLSPVPGGTEVTFLCEDVPPGISAEDHAEGLNASLENLAEFIE